MGIAFGSKEDAEIEKYFRSKAFMSLKWQEYQSMSATDKMSWIRKNPSKVLELLSYLDGVIKGWK